MRNKKATRRTVKGLLVASLALICVGCNNNQDSNNMENTSVSHSDTFVKLDAQDKTDKDNTTKSNNQTLSEDYNDGIVDELNEAIKQNESNIEDFKPRQTEITEDKEKFFTYHGTELLNNFEFTDDKPYDIKEIATIDPALADTMYYHLIQFCDSNSLDINTLKLSDDKNFPVQFINYYSYIFNISGKQVYAVCNPLEGCYITILE